MRETSRYRQLIELPVPPTMATLQTTSMALDLSGATICTGGAVAGKKEEWQRPRNGSPEEQRV